MKISVIVPYEGYYQYLKDCLESLSEQENVEIETLLVGSQDDQKFQQLVDTYKDKISLNVIPCSIEEGVAKKRNLGLENATGDYIYFIDSDDYIMPQTLSCLLQDAMQKDLDLVVGRRWITWFKKQVFETMGDEKNEELNLKDKDDDRNHKFLEKDYSDIDDSDEQRRIDLLIRAKKGIRNISVLNILIKRTLIEENHLRFNEGFIYYSDLPFVEGLVMYGHKIDFNDKTLYAKRKHNDPINTPALSQIKDETKFDEFINVYKYAISLVDKESRIRYYLDSKMIKYYSNFFAKKIRRSKDDFWRDERFDQMSILMQDVRDDLLKNMSHYQRKMVKLARNHDLQQTQKVIAKHLAKNKMKKILKNKNNLKFSFKTTSITTYLPSIIFAIISIIFAIYSIANNISPYYLIALVAVNIVVFACIHLSCTTFGIYNDCVVVKNNYAELNEIQSVVLEKSKKGKENLYELKVTTKFDLLICTVVSDDAKSLLRQIKSNLPKNIKIKELAAK